MTTTYHQATARDQDLLNLAEKVLTQLRGELEPEDRQAMSTHVLALVALAAELRIRQPAPTTKAEGMCTPGSPGRNNCAGQLFNLAEELGYRS
jgi:hypothetical protein